MEERSSTLADRHPRLAEACKLSLGALAQALENPTHVPQLCLQFGTRLVARALVELEVYVTLNLGCFLVDILRHRLRNKFGVQGSLHQGRQGVSAPLHECVEEGDGDLCDKVRQDACQQRMRGGCRWVARRKRNGGRDFVVDENERQHGVVDIRPDMLRWAGGWNPVRRSDALADVRVQRGNRGLRVGLEEPSIDLVDYVTYGLGLLCQLDRESCLKVRHESRDEVRLECLEIRQSEQHPNVLFKLVTEATSDKLVRNSPYSSHRCCLW